MAQMMLGQFAGLPALVKEEDGYVSHPLVRPGAIAARGYQLSIARAALRESTAVILPTGLGKTVIAALVMAETLPRKILFLAPTKPLVLQHAETCQSLLLLPPSATLTGQVAPGKREKTYREAGVIFATPQTILSDLEAGRYALDDVGLVIYDEMHRAVENYAYVRIAGRYGGLALGLTASPGTTKKKVQQILGNLGLTRIESRTREDADVAPYVQDVTIDWRRVELPESLLLIHKPLDSLLQSSLAKLRRFGFLRYKKTAFISKTDILACSGQILARLARRKGGYLFAAMKAQATALQAYHCLELLETQGVEPLRAFLEKSASDPKKERWLGLPEMRQVRALVDCYAGASHPKLASITAIVSGQLTEKSGSKLIIFTQYRDTIPPILMALEGIRKAVPSKFVGQAAGAEIKGMRQAEQAAVLQQFREGKVNVLVATSIGEEGLDIPAVDLVVFYEPIPSAIRAIQRRGRTGRSEIGKVTILLAKGTRDEGYYNAMVGREEKMRRLVGRLGKKGTPPGER